MTLAAERPAAANPAMLVSQWASLSESLAIRWPDLPERHTLSFEEQITERISQVGNQIGDHLGELSHDMFRLRVDARHRRAHLGFGGGDATRFALRVDSDIQFDDLDAHVDMLVDVGYHGHTLKFALPSFQVGPTEYRSSYGVAVKLPLFVRRF
ncbi:MAG TPA: hypothetical protein VFP84_20255 [Kofleriaceae bacterium]|nr:hypothetical protein [Kofleriaceae bacterium]